MTDGASLYHEELLDQEQRLDALLLPSAASPSPSSSSSSPSLSASDVAKAQTTMKRVNKLYQQLRMEVRLLDDAKVQKAFEAHVQAHAQTISRLKAALQQAQQKSAESAAAAAASAGSGGSATRALPPLAPSSPALLSSANANAPAYSLWSPPADGDSGGGRGGEDDDDDGKDAARKAAQRIHSTQQGTLQSLGNTEKLLNETETIGNEAGTTLRTQTEQIQQTNQELDDMHSEVGRAGKELKAFMRRMARDRIVIIMSIAIVVCLVVIIVLAVLKHRG